jgi:hypothetical protein
MQQPVLGRRHVAGLHVRARGRQRCDTLDRVFWPFRKIYYLPRAVHVPGDHPGNGSHRAVPRPLGSVRVAIRAGPFQQLPCRGRNLQPGLQCALRLHRRVWWTPRRQLQSCNYESGTSHGNLDSGRLAPAKRCRRVPFFYDFDDCMYAHEPIVRGTASVGRGRGVSIR